MAKKEETPPIEPTEPPKGKPVNPIEPKDDNTPEPKPFNGLDLSPIKPVLDEINAGIKTLNEGFKAPPKKDEIIPTPIEPEPPPKKDKYKLFDEFDVTKEL